MQGWRVSRYHNVTMPEDGGLNTGLAIGTIFLLLLLLSGDVELNPVN